MEKLIRLFDPREVDPITIAEVKHFAEIKYNEQEKIKGQIARELANGGQVQLIGFGTFEVKERNARKGINPRTGETITIPAHKAPIFRAGKSLKAEVNI